MARYGNLDGTLRENFQIGPELGTGFRRNENGELVLYDPVAGMATLKQLLESGGAITTNGIITREGGLVYSRNRLVGGPVKLVVQQP